MSWIWICPADRTRPALQPRFSVVIAKRPHPFPFRTRKLSSSAPMVLHGRLCGRVGRRRILTPRALTYFTSGPVSFPLHSPFPFPPQQPLSYRIFLSFSHHQACSLTRTSPLPLICTFSGARYLNVQYISISFVLVPVVSIS